MKCPSCGAELPGESNFCPSCGNPRPRQQGALFCPGCGQQTSAGQGFCTSCGTKVDEPGPTAPSQPPPAGPVAGFQEYSSQPPRHSQPPPYSGGPGPAGRPRPAPEAFPAVKGAGVGIRAAATVIDIIIFKTPGKPIIEHIFGGV